MRRFVPLMGLSLCLTTPAYASTPVFIGGGVERFVWQEYNVNDSKLVKESGQRMFVSVEADNEVSDRWTYGFRGRIYSGTVNCDGQVKSGTCSSDTDYDGAAITADFTGRFIGTDGAYTDLALRFGVTGDVWKRQIAAATSYNEEYFVVSGTLGLAYVPEQGWFGDAGVKYPLLADEDVKLYDKVSVSPQGAFSVYANVGYNFNQRWAIKGYYDSYRFKPSDRDTLTNGGVVVGDIAQPESSMDSYGVTVGFYF